MRTNEEDTRVTELMRVYDQTVAELKELGLDIVSLRALDAEGTPGTITTEYRTLISVGALKLPEIVVRESRQEAEEWVTDAREEYGEELCRAKIQTRTVTPWKDASEPVDFSHCSVCGVKAEDCDPGGQWYASCPLSPVLGNHKWALGDTA